MPEQLPETRFLDMAAKAVGDGKRYHDWYQAERKADLETLDSIIAHARTLAELAALKPVPEVDEDAEALKRVLQAWHQGKLFLDVLERINGWPAALAAFKSERPRRTPEQATEIAREICARVAESLELPTEAANYRNGLYNAYPRVQFAKAMLLHETGDGK